MNTTKDADANQETNVGTDVDDKELIGGILTSCNGISSMPCTKALTTDPENLKLVQLHMTIKKRKGDLLEHLSSAEYSFQTMSMMQWMQWMTPKVHTMKSMKLSRNKRFQLKAPK